MEVAKFHRRYVRNEIDRGFLLGGPGTCLVCSPSQKARLIFIDVLQLPHQLSLGSKGLDASQLR